MTTLSAEYHIVNRLGLHARAAAQLVQTANRFISDVIIEKDGNEWEKYHGAFDVGGSSGFDNQHHGYR